MHAGLNSGRFLFTLTGTEHRELIVSGPAASITVEMEGASVAGEILVGPETAAALPAAALGEPRASGFLLARPPDAEQGLKPLPPVDGLPLADCVPQMIREHISSDHAEPEQRMAAVAFLRLSGADELVATDGPEAAARAVAATVQTVQAAAAEHEVCFLESDIEQNGARIVLVAGAPRVSEHDVERLLRTVRAAVDGGDGLRLSAGVSRGRVFAGEVGAPFRRTYTILGGTAALAARLMAKAQPGQILVPEELLELSGTRFDAEPIEPLRMKGLAEPVRAVVLGAIQSAGLDTTQPTAVAPLIGRQREVAVLTAALAPVRMGFGTMLELVGEAGLGKTRLMQELRANAGELRVIGARCDEYESSTPYFVFRSLLRPLVGADLDGTRPRTRGRCARSSRMSRPGSSLDPAARPPSRRRRRAHARGARAATRVPARAAARVVEELLRSLLPDPTLVLVEDVHWIDEASSELLRHLGATNATDPGRSAARAGRASSGSWRRTACRRSPR